MAKRANKKAVKSSSGFKPFVLGLLVGASGMFLYVGVIQENRPTNVGSGLQNLITAATEAQKAEQQVASVESVSDQPANPTDGFKFNFYDVLLEDEYILPQTPEPESNNEVAAVDQQPEPAAKQKEVAKTVEIQSFYVLQAASYKAYGDADKLKAQLALSGHSAYIQKVTIEGRGEYFRVRLGPFDNLTKMRSTKNALADLGIKTLSFKMKGEA